MSESLPEPAGADQIEAFAGELCNLINRYVDQFDLPCAAIIGVLQMEVVERTMNQVNDSRNEEIT